MNYSGAFAFILISCLCLPEDKKETNFEKVMFDGMRTFAKVLEITEKRHYQVADPQSCFDESIKAFLNCLDPHTTYLDPKTYQRILELSNGEFYGVGIVIDNTRTDKDKALLVIDTIPEGPSDKAGVKPFDKIVEIDGEALEGKSTDELITKLKGERSTKVTIKVMREGKQDLLSFTLTRDTIQEQQSLCFYIKNENIYYLSLSTFANNSVKQLENLLKKSTQTTYKGLILDLRNNVGGILDVAVDIVGLFLERNSLVVSIRDKDGVIRQEYRTSREPVTNATVPIFILINNYTASAAEILAGCLQQHSNTSNKIMVFIVGIDSFGKGSVQEVIPLGNSALKLTTSLYFLPSGNTIQGVGIQPDFEIEKYLPQPEQIKWFKKFYGREKNLTHYIQPHKDKTKSPEEIKKTDKKSWIERAKESLEEDNQVRETITLINLFNFARQAVPEQVDTRQQAVDFINSIVVGNKPLTLIEVKT